MTITSTISNQSNTRISPRTSQLLLSKQTTTIIPELLGYCENADAENAAGLTLTQIALKKHDVYALAGLWNARDATGRLVGMSALYGDDEPLLMGLGGKSPEKLHDRIGTLLSLVKDASVKRLLYSPVVGQ